MLVRLHNLLHQLGASFWLIPGIMCISAYLLSLLALWLDSQLSVETAPAFYEALLYRGDANSAITLLSTIASSMITVSGVTFSVTVVALSLASSQYGPRLLLNFMKDRGNQVVLGTFVATFLYCLLVLWHGREPGLEDSFPASASIAVLLAILSVWVLIFFFHHVSQSIRAENIVLLVAKEVMSAIQHYLDKHADTKRTSHSQLEQYTPEFSFELCSQKYGYVQALDPNAICELASENDMCIEFCCKPGGFVTKDQTLIRASKECDAELQERLRMHIIIGPFRTDEDDPAYGIHQLVEVAVRALSPGINDPNTAISCIDWLEAIVQRFITCNLPNRLVFDDNDELRLIMKVLEFDSVVATAFNQIRQNAYDTPSVAIHLMAALANLSTRCTTKERFDPLMDQAQMLLKGTLEQGLMEKDERDLISRFKRIQQEESSHSAPRDNAAK